MVKQFCDRCGKETKKVFNVTCECGIPTYNATMLANKISKGGYYHYELCEYCVNKLVNFINIEDDKKDDFSFDDPNFGFVKNYADDEFVEDE